MCLIASVDWSLLGWISVILMVAVGLGTVIFVHELGHFLVAKACGVKCEKFMIGFDIGGYKISHRWGETVYGIGILPLGGYVKMLGQDDDPAHIAEQMQKSQIDAHNADAVPVKGPNGETYYVDRRSYLAKSVPQRMAIISAGVVMNVIFAFIFAVIAYGMGVQYLPSIVSETMPGSPAWQANIEPGDEIVQINDRVDPTFLQLKGGVTLGDMENGIPCRIRRAADGSVVSVTLKPQQDTGHLATIGVGGPLSLTLSENMPAVDDSAAARAKLVAPAADKIDKDDASFKGGDEIVRVGDAPVKNYREYSTELARQADQNLRVTVRRTAATSKSGEKGKAAADDQASQELTFEVPKQPLHRFDFDLKIGPITSVRADSPAAKAGLAAGDVIEKLDGKKLGEGASPQESWTAQTLPDYLRRAAKEGREVEITVERQKADGQNSGPGTARLADGQTEPVSLHLKPVVPATMSSDISARSPGTPMAANEIGIAYRIDNELAAVTPNSPATAADLKPGDKINAVKIAFPKDEKGVTPEPLIVKFVRDKPTGLAALIRKLFGGEVDTRPLPNWPTVADAVQFLPEGADVEFTVQRGDAEPRQLKLKPTVAEGMYIAARGFWLKPIERIRKASSFSEQLRYGWDETSDALTMVFSFLKKLGTQVPISALGGPVTIAKAAGYSAAEGMSSLLIFLTMLSANLAVINLLPIPLLDGGHLVFLAYEGLRGRPANEKFVVALHTAGFVLIVTLMLYVLALDLSLIPRDL